MKPFKLSLLGIICASVFVTSYADHQSCQNQISMQLQEEGWVSSTTAQVTVSIQAATNKDNSSEVVASITKKLKSVVNEKDPVAWRLVDLSTEKNSAGLFAISAKMSARLNNAQLTQLQNMIQSLNKAGEQYKVDSIDYQPTLAEIADENTRLRVLLYKDVLGQEQIINSAFADKKYQLQTLSFDSPYTATPRPMVMFAGNAATRQASASTSTPFSQQLILTANVTFSSPNVACEKK
ncbi:MAG: hypothetical protein V4496_03695 [Pseudomonadota bacterium]